MKLLVFTILITIAWFPFTQSYALETERITNYDSQVVINRDSSLLVTENITVYAAGDQIKRGVYRDFPTKYHDARGINYQTTFEVQEVLRDGIKEDYRIENLSNGKRLYIGNSEVYLNPGFYTYTIKYRTTNQLGFFDEHDELYFNLTGNGWNFTIEKVAATIILPEGVNSDTVKLKAYTGVTGSKGTSYRTELIEIGRRTAAYFTTTSPLNSYEGLTIVAGWPKGFVDEPTLDQKLINLLMNNLVLVVGCGLILATVAYYVVMWLRYGRDPKGSEVMVTRFDISKDISPAGARYIYQMGFDNQVVTASLVNLAVKGLLKITEEKGDFTIALDKTNDYKVFEEEKILLNNFFANSKTSFTFKNSAAKKINSTIAKFKNSLAKNYLNKYFRNNDQFLVIPLLVSFLYLVGSFLVVSTGLIYLGIFAVLIVISIIGAQALKARTVVGREIQDQILGLRNYLTAVESPRYSSKINYEVPDTLKVYEKYLPYAIALDVEPVWTGRFKDQIEKAQVVETEQSGALYLRSFYTGKVLAGSLGNSLTSAIASSTTPPGSRSGFSGGSGGGSSGGGGGGGGGGGW